MAIEPYPVLIARPTKLKGNVRATLFKIITDQEGESKITFAVPSNELVNVVRMNTLWQQEIDLQINPNTEPQIDEE